MELFPKEMSNADMTLESVASKLTYFQLQLHLLHWQTTSFSEHKATDKLYGFVSSFKDEVIEKLMGYTGRRIKPYAIPVLGTETTTNLVNNICNWAYNLEKWAEKNKYCDIENLAQSLSGAAAQTKYLLTLT